MFKIKNKNIYLNRGDAISIELKCSDGNSFSAGDTLIFSVVSKDNFGNAVFQKSFTINEDCSSYILKLDAEDTKIGNMIKSGTVTYWYEIELNGDTTLIGYDDNGAKLFVLYPEAPTIGGSI